MVTGEPEEPQQNPELLEQLLDLKRKDLKLLLQQLGGERPSAVALAAKENIARIPPRDLKALAQAIGDDDFSTVVDLVRRRAKADDEEDPERERDLKRVVRAVAESERSVVIEAARREVHEVPSLLRSVEPRPRAILKQAEAAVRDAADNDDERTLADEIGDVLRRFAAAHAAEL